MLMRGMGRYGQTIGVAVAFLGTALILWKLPSLIGQPVRLIELIAVVAVLTLGNWVMGSWMRLRGEKY